jgi:hypothetical protein
MAAVKQQMLRINRRIAPLAENCPNYACRNLKSGFDTFCSQFMHIFCINVL